MNCFDSSRYISKPKSIRKAENNRALWFVVVLLSRLTMKLALIYTCFLFKYASAQTLVWSDEFDGAAGQLPDASKWGHNTGDGGDGWGILNEQFSELMVD